jgi:hypothetical protein
MNLIAISHIEAPHEVDVAIGEAGEAKVRDRFSNNNGKVGVQPVQVRGYEQMIRLPVLVDNVRANQARGSMDRSGDRNNDLFDP